MDDYNFTVKYLNEKYGSRPYDWDRITDHDDKELSLLLSQYAYGISVKKELHNKLLNMNLIKEQV